MLSSVFLRGVPGGAPQLGLRSLATYTERMNATGRPVSPHVTTYAWPVVAISSITMRVTGGLLSVGVGGVAAMALVSGGAAPAALASALGASALAPVAKFAARIFINTRTSVGYPLVYHFLGACRHTVWDRNPAQLENASVEKSSYALLGGAGVIAAGLSFVSFKKAD